MQRPRCMRDKGADARRNPDRSVPPPDEDGPPSKLCSRTSNSQPRGEGAGPVQLTPIRNEKEGTGPAGGGGLRVLFLGESFFRTPIFFYPPGPPTPPGGGGGPPTPPNRFDPSKSKANSIIRTLGFSHS